MLIRMPNGSWIKPETVVAITCRAGIVGIVRVHQSDGKISTVHTMQCSEPQKIADEFAAEVNKAK